MAVTTLRLSDGGVVSIPRGADWAANLFTGIWRAIERHREARARRELYIAAARLEDSDPGMAADLRAALTRGR